MLVIQVILILFFLFVIGSVIQRYRVGDLSWRAAAFWILFWIAAGVIVIEPNATFYVAHLVGVGRGADVVVYVALVIIFFILFQFILKLTRLERNLTKVVRELALRQRQEIDKTIK